MSSRPAQLACPVPAHHWPAAFAAAPAPGRARPPALRGRRPRAVALLCLAAGCWALYTPITSAALTRHTPMPLLLVGQVAVAAIVMWLVVALRGHRRVPHLRRVVLISALDPAGNTTLWAVALTSVQAAEGSLLATSECVLVAVLGVLILHERPAVASWAGLLVCLPGLWLLAGMPVSLALSAGVALSLASTTASALYCTAVAWMSRTTNTLMTTFTAWQYTFGLLWLLLAVAVIAPLREQATIAALGQLDPGAAALTVLGGLLLGTATLLYNIAVRSISITEAGIVLNLIPVGGAVIGVLWLGNTLTLAAIAGGAITFAGIVLYQAGPALIRLQRRTRGWADRAPLPFVLSARKDHSDDH
ncbi:DMT family transporter [Nonomuraea sp. NPDC050536]|uniref:DMT family transporter n=1 Tax=Nonomuraea sp. NPDC050536 TaxID=3364366 RepID=UPI0037C96BD9